jgi:hypothetical protein
MMIHFLLGVLSLTPTPTPIPGVEPLEFRLDEIPIEVQVRNPRVPAVIQLPPLPEHSCQPATSEWRLRLPGMCNMHKARRSRGGFRVTLERAF